MRCTTEGCGRAALPDNMICGPCLECMYAAAEARKTATDAKYAVKRAAHVAKLREAGICTRCGAAAARPGYVKCGPCAEQHTAKYGARQHERAKANRDARREAGLCVKCGREPARPGRVTCVGCAAKHAAKRAARSGAGLCVLCEAAARPGRVTCAWCADREAARYAARYSSRRAAKHRERKAAGICVTCGREPARPGRVTCAGCAAKLSAACRRPARGRRA